MKFFAKTSGKRGEIYVYDAIGGGFFSEGVTAKSFAESVKALGDVKALDIYINSPGGSVFEGLAIYNQIKRFDGEKIVHIDGIAASIASVIAMAGDEVRIAANGTIMIHDPWGMAMGTAADMRKQADSLDKVRDVLLENYVARTGAKRDDVSAWMSAETWMNADEAVERGFATSKVEEKQFSAAFPMLEKFNKVPDSLRKQATASTSLLARMQMRTQKLNLGASPKTA
ncbi:head maturation protease, ClpP-related [Variovorax paradoxus]|uniref:head maturation protease, ClpP-related n=1 Tax=Variovorax paradoxus TaxID=34073 RepID=UPI0019338E52|nr:Clp protease ClpP [Variovorax paradoxus]